MGDEMKKLMNVIKNEFKNNNKILLLIIIITIVGFISGTLFITILDKADKDLVVKSIADLFNKIKLGEIDYGYTFRTSLLSNVLYITTIFLLGISIIGIPIVIVMTFLKSFILGFSLSSIIFKYKLSGTLLSLSYVFPHQIINILIVSFISIYSIKVSLSLLKLITSKKIINFKLIMKKYTVIYIFCLLIGIISSVSETFLTPNFINLFAFLYK